MQEGAGGLEVTVRVADRDGGGLQGQARFRREPRSTTRPARCGCAPVSPTRTAFCSPACSGASTCRARCRTAACWCPTRRSAPTRTGASSIVVDDGRQVSAKPVRIGPQLDGYRVIREGLTGDETIVVNGLMRVRPGVKVKRRDDDAAARRPRPPGCEPMRFAHFFVDRPIFASVLSIVLLIVGGIAYSQLPVAQYPEIAPPTIVVRAAYPGADAETVAETVATPIEQEVNGVEDMLYMSSYSSRRRRDGADHHLQARHRSRQGAGAGAEPRRDRRAAPAGRRAPPRRHDDQELARPDDGRAHAVARRHATTSSTSRTMPAPACATCCCGSTASATSSSSASANIRCASGSIRRSCPAYGMTVRRRRAGAARPERPGVRRLDRRAADQRRQRPSSTR